MKLKKFLSLSLALSLSLVSLAGCTSGSKAASQDPAPSTGEATASAANFNPTGYPVVNEPIKLNAVTLVTPTNGDFNSMEILTSIDEKTGVDVVYEGIASNVWPEKKNLIFASTDLPDIFMGGGLSDSDIIKYSQQGLLLPLDELINQYAPNVKKMLDENPKVEKALRSPDGKIYTLPYFDQFLPENIPDNLYLNKSWLDTLGLEVPKTTDEFYEVLKAFKTQDPNGNGQADEIPFTYRADQAFTGELSLFGAFGALDNREHLMITDGKVNFGPALDGYKDGINWFNKLYTENLIDAEVFTQDQSQYVAKGKNEETIVGAFVIYSDENYIGAEKAYNDYVALEPLKGPNGDQLWNRYDNNLQVDKFALTSANEHPEATMRWIDEFFNDEISLQTHWGSIGSNLEKQGDQYSFQTPPDGMSIDEYRFKNAPGPNAPGIMTPAMYDSLEFAMDKQRKIERYAIYDPFANKEPLPRIRFGEAEAQEVAILFSDLDSYVKEMKAKWISGERDVNADWDDYLAQLEKMKVDRYVEIYQGGYDIYK